jgi:two-component system, NarL family, sensor histidine kinase UhpB
MAVSEAGARGIVRSLLGLSLKYKLLIANGAIVFVAAAVSAAVVHRALMADPSASAWATILLIVLATLIASLVINALVIRAALSPLALLDQTADRVSAGDLDARAPLSPVADRNMEELVRTFNAMLDSIAESRARLRDVASRALDAAEAERLRISHVLHDDIAQSLAAILVQLRVARAQQDANRREALLASLGDEMSKVMDDLRAVAGELRPPALDMIGLKAALESHARLVSEHTGVKVDVVADRFVTKLSPESELALYRLVQDALSNVVRHANAGAATLRITSENGSVQATLIDNGRGFSIADALRKNGAIGLLGMHERAAYVGGTVDIESAPGKGTVVRIKLPVTAKDHA